MISRRGDSETSDYVAHAQPGSDDYKRKVADVTMRAIDAMPAAYRRLVHEFGYVDIYRAWKRGWSPEKIRSRAVNGVFKL